MDQSQGLLIQLHAFLIFAFLTLLASPPIASVNTEDAYFLYNFKQRINQDPTGALNSWKLNSAARPCDWEGVDCDVTVLKGIPVVRGVSLPNRNILGTLWTDLGNLRFLRILNLTGNRFQGQIMSYVGDVRVLETLDLSNNAFTGVLPAFKKLVYLKTLVLFNNNFEGDFPGTACDGQALRYIDMSSNHLRGIISKDVYKCSKLETLKLSDNALHGDVPAELGELTNLRILNLARNQLTGRLPEAIGAMTYLTHLLLTDNQFTGFITPSISAATYMQVLDLSNNQIGKNIPDSLGSLAFLERISLSNNKLQGSIPPGIGRLSSLVSFLDLSHNMLTGDIPSEIGNLEHLQKINLSSNRISGSLPDTWGGCYALRVLDLSQNHISGSMPVSMKDLANIQYLNLSYNRMSGEVRLVIGNLKTISALDLSHNNFTGHVPESFGSLSTLMYFDGSYNKLTGSLPKSLGNLTNIDVFDLSHNELSGELLDIPLFRHFAAAGYLEDEKDLCGPVLNITCSSNPNTLVNIGKEVLKFLKSNQDIIKYIPLFVCAVLVAGVTVGWMSCLLLRSFQPMLYEETMECCDIKLSPVLRCFGRKSRLSMSDLQLATDNFSKKNIIGFGKRSKVYWGQLSKREPLAIKVLEPELIWETRTHFLKDCKLLRTLSHKNVMQVVDWSYKPHFLAIVYKYMSRGSLYDNLYAQIAAIPLSWDERLGISIDVAHGLSFLHRQGKKQQLAQCHLCPCNILLDQNCRAYIAGLHVVGNKKGSIAAGVLTRKNDNRVAPQDFTNYVAPECASEDCITEQAEVYSYGLTVLEIITRKRSAVGVLSLHGSLPARMRALFPHKVKQLIDTGILRTTTNSNQVLALIEIALSCTEDDPFQRPDMRSVVLMLAKVKNGEIAD